jgi:hypothetical protein
MDEQTAIFGRFTASTLTLCNLHATMSEDDDDETAYRHKGWYSESRYGSNGYSKGRRSEEVTFYRPDGSVEGKDVGWCLDNDFHEIEAGLWSGDWYYRHFPDFKKEQVAREEQERKMMSDPAFIAEEKERRKKQRRAELLSDIYDFDGPRISARLALEAFDKSFNEFSCPLSGCKECFATDDEMQEHVKYQTGQGHIHYRKENNIKEWLDCDDIEEVLGTVEEQSPQPIFVDTTERKQTDIRFFFKATAGHKNSGLEGTKLSEPADRIDQGHALPRDSTA